ncbi:GNAT family N-acetyltransferase [Nocardioidaceae bacterium SCSIO 66511]|nr:GNAT family N-acetyltransferase [Nocardioidaceae bacterium SCSIO 66511]
MTSTPKYDVYRLTDPNDTQFLQLHDLVTTMVEQGAALGWVEPPSERDLRELVADLIQAGELDNACLVVAETLTTAGEQPQIVGFAYWNRREGETEEPHADIAKVAVSADARGGGLGRRMVEELISYGRKVGVEILTLDVRGNNHAAMQLYERLGFREYGRIEDFVAVDNERWDNVYFSLDLREAAEDDLVRHGDSPLGPGASRRRT